METTIRCWNYLAENLLYCCFTPADRLFEFSAGQNKEFLHVPSAIIADTSGKIMFEYINPDYKTNYQK